MFRLSNSLVIYSAVMMATMTMAMMIMMMLLMMMMMMRMMMIMLTGCPLMTLLLLIPHMVELYNFLSVGFE